MSLFRAIVGVAVEAVTLPVAIALDTVTAFPDACDPYGPPVGHRTRETLDAIKDEADEAKAGK